MQTVLLGVRGKGSAGGWGEGEVFGGGGISVF